MAGISLGSRSIVIAIAQAVPDRLEVLKRGLGARVGDQVGYDSIADAYGNVIGLVVPYQVARRGVYASNDDLVAYLAEDVDLVDVHGNHDTWNV